VRRRELLALAARAGIGVAALAALPPALRQALAAGGGPPLLERNLWPRQWETSLAALDRAPLTPNELFFVRSHLPTPDPKLRDWRLTVQGRVATEISFTLSDLRRMPQHELTCVIECAGNGRGLYRLPNTSGTQWEHGAVGNARWRGVPLGELLKRVGTAPDATDVWFEAADRSPFGKVPPFLRSIPMDKARADVLLATEMNGAPLPPLHGAPCRVVVPGWYGMASTKWVTGIRVEDRPSDNHFMARGYRYQYPDAGHAEAAPVREIQVKSLITSVLDGEGVPAGQRTVAGWAWSDRAIARVEVSTDDMASWHEAQLGESLGEYAWRRWEYAVQVPATDPLTLAVRATDEAGHVQPVAARVNAAGYANNSIHRITLHARG